LHFAEEFISNLGMNQDMRVVGGEKQSNGVRSSTSDNSTAGQSSSSSHQSSSTDGHKSSPTVFLPSAFVHSKSGFFRVGQQMESLKIHKCRLHQPIAQRKL
jgi:hypothetical protein